MSAPITKPLTITSWILQAIAAAILAMAAFPKLAGDETSVAMFEALGQPWMMGVVGVGEAIAVVLLLVPRTIAYGAILSGFLMLGAVGSHITRLGISIPESVHPDLAGPSLFVMAVGVLVASLGVLFIRRGSLPVVGAALSPQPARG